MFLGGVNNWKHKIITGDREHFLGSVLCCHNFAFSWDQKTRTWPLETFMLPSHDGGLHNVVQEVNIQHFPVYWTSKRNTVCFKLKFSSQCKRENQIPENNPCLRIQRGM